MSPQIIDRIIERSYSSVSCCSENDDDEVVTMVIPPDQTDLETGGGTTTTAVAAVVAAVLPPNATDTVPTTTSSSWWSSCRNCNMTSYPLLLELLTCLAFFITTNVLPSHISLGHWIFGILPTEPHERPIPYMKLSNNDEDEDYDMMIRNLSYNEAYVEEETVPFPLLIALSGILPLVLQLLTIILTSCCSGRCCGSSNNNKNSRRLTTTTTTQLLHNTLCVYWTAWSLNMLATEFVKNYVGYLRPVFYDLCQPSSDYATCQNENHGMRKSFPSGHAATAFCGLTLLTLYFHTQWGVGAASVQQKKKKSKNHGKRYVLRRQLLQQQQPPERFVIMTATTEPESEKERYQEDSCYGDDNICVYDDDNDFYVLEYDDDDDDSDSDSCYGDAFAMARRHFISILALLPMAVALWIAASRVRDNRHFPADVIAGALIGASIAVYCHGLWFVG